MEKGKERERRRVKERDGERKGERERGGGSISSAVAIRFALFIGISRLGW